MRPSGLLQSWRTKPNGSCESSSNEIVQHAMSGRSTMGLFIVIIIILVVVCLFVVVVVVVVNSHIHFASSRRMVVVDDQATIGLPVCWLLHGGLNKSIGQWDCWKRVSGR